MARQSPRQQRFGMAVGSAPGAAAVPPGMIISRMDRLRRAEEPEKARRVALEAVTGSPATAAGMLAMLHAASRSADADMLLHVIASTDAANCGAVVHALKASGAEADALGLVRLLQSRSAADIAAAAAAYDSAASASPGGRAPDNPLLAGLASRPLDGLIAEIAALRDSQRDGEAALLLTVVGNSSPDAAWEAAANLARRGLTTDAADVLVRHIRTAAPADAARLFRRLAGFWESAAAYVAPIVGQRDDAAAVLVEVQDPGIVAKYLSPQQTAELCRSLAGRSAAETLDDLLGWCAGHGDARELQAALHQAGLHAAAYRLAERLAEFTGRYEA